MDDWNLCNCACACACGTTLQLASYIAIASYVPLAIIIILGGNFLHHSYRISLQNLSFYVAPYSLFL